MAKRNVQFFRNKSVIGSYDTHQDAITGAENKFSVIAQDPGLLDGEIVLYRYTINDSATIHTIVGVVCEKDGDKHIEILGNYDILNGEITKALDDAKAYTDTQFQGLDAIVSNEDEENQPVVVKITQVDGKLTSVEVTTSLDVTTQIEAALAALDGTATIASVANGVVTLKGGIKQTTGEISNNSDLVDITLAKVATSGKAEDVTITDSDSVITATTVEGALVEIAKEIDGMKLDATDVVALNDGKTALQASKISETDGKVSVAQAQPIVEFNQAISSTNKVATMSDITAAAYTEGTNVTIGNDRSINVPLGLAYDSTNKKIKLTQGTDDNATVIDSIDATAFIKDGMLETAELATNPTGKPNGTYIKLTFNTDAGKDVIYIDVTSLIDTYTGDKYITVKNYTIKHNEQNVDTGNSYTTTITGEIVEPNDSQGRQEGQTIYGSELTFTVPSLKVDKAGHIVELYSEEIKFILPPLPTAREITITDTNDNFTATNVEGALAELAGDITTAVEGIKNYATIKVGETSIAPATHEAELVFAGDDIISIEASESENTSDTLTFKHKTVEPETIETTDSTSTTIEVPVLEFDSYGHISKKGTQKYIITIPTQLTSSVAAGNGITVTPVTTDNNTEYTVEVKLNPNTNDMLSVDADGLNLSNSWDCGEYI